MITYFNLGHSYADGLTVAAGINESSLNTELISGYLSFYPRIPK